MMTEKVETLLSHLQNASTSELPELIANITETPGLFVFGEFLDHQCVQNLENSPLSALRDLLYLFCYGSYQTYCQNKDKYPELKPGQIRKLKQLSIIDEAHKQKRIPYSLLFNSLGISSSWELEELVIELFYLEALTGKLDQQMAVLEVDSAIGRDIQWEQVPELHSKIASWCSHVESVLSNMAKEIQLANERRYESELHNKEVLETAASIREALRGKLNKSEASSLRMDVDDVLNHPDLLSDGRSDSARHGNSVDSPGGDKDTRSRMVMFKNIRHGKNSK